MALIDSLMTVYAMRAMRVETTLQAIKYLLFLLIAYEDANTFSLLNLIQKENIQN